MKIINLFVILITPHLVYSQMSFKGEAVEEITISKDVYEQCFFNKENPYVTSNRTKEERLIYKLDLASGVFFDCKRRKTRSIKQADTLQISNLLMHLCNAKELPVIRTECHLYTFIVQGSPDPLTPINCYKEQLDEKNPDNDCNRITYSMINFSVRKQLGEIFKGEFRRLFCEIKNKLCLLYKSDLECSENLYHQSRFILNTSN